MRLKRTILAVTSILLSCSLSAQATVDPTAKVVERIVHTGVVTEAILFEPEEMRALCGADTVAHPELVPSFARGGVSVENPSQLPRCNEAQLSQMRHMTANLSATRYALAPLALVGAVCAVTFVVGVAGQSYNPNSGMVSGLTFIGSGFAAGYVSAASQLSVIGFAGGVGLGAICGGAGILFAVQFIN